MKKADIKQDGTCVDPDQTLTRHHIQVRGLKVKTRIKGGAIALRPPSTSGLFFSCRAPWRTIRTGGTYHRLCLVKLTHRWPGHTWPSG